MYEINANNKLYFQIKDTILNPGNRSSLQAGLYLTNLAMLD